MGTGLGHYIPIVAYLGFWVMCIGVQGMPSSGPPDTLLNAAGIDAEHISAAVHKFL